MLRLLILLECDQCQEMITSTPNSSDRLGTDWPEEIYTLEYEAEQNGWSVYRSQHVCGPCVMSAMAEQHQGHDCDLDTPF
jgi:hypothetical protein